jgi:hypothetical protein
MESTNPQTVIKSEYHVIPTMIGAKEMYQLTLTLTVRRSPARIERGLGMAVYTLAGVTADPNTDEGRRHILTRGVVSSAVVLNCPGLSRGGPSMVCQRILDIHRTCKSGMTGGGIAPWTHEEHVYVVRGIGIARSAHSSKIARRLQWVHCS